MSTVKMFPMLMISIVITDVEIPGRVTWNIFPQRPQPSTSAASYNSMFIAEIPAMYITAL